MTSLILRGDARAVPLPDRSVDLVVTSPPFYGLRAYEDGGQVLAGQIGMEETPAEYIAALVECTREWARVLKPTGSIWVNLGDVYASRADGRRNTTTAAPAKSLLLLPERYRIACTDELGLIARAVTIWSKPNGLPESVTDRVRRSHEDWVHLTKRPNYYSAVDRIRLPHSASTIARAQPHRAATSGVRDAYPQGIPAQTIHRNQMIHTLGALPGSVWNIPTEPLRVPEDLGTDHFAAFPVEWPRRIIQGWSPSGWCTTCGEARRPAVDRGPARGDFNGNCGRTIVAGRSTNSIERNRIYAERIKAGIGPRILGERCACDEPTAPTRPAVVLDPFSGTGTTALVASALGRIGIGVDRSGDYCRIATWRATDPGQIAKAKQVPKPPVETDGQLDLFGEEVAS